VKHTCDLSSISSIAITKLDVLKGIDTLKICVGYKYHDKQIDTMPSSLLTLKNCTPVYEEFNGWNHFPTHPKQRSDLPEEAQKYIQFIEKYLSTPMSIISYGPERDETIQC